MIPNNKIDENCSMLTSWFRSWTFASHKRVTQMSKMTHPGLKAGLVAVTAASLMALGIAPASADDYRGGTTNCSSKVRISSQTYAPGYGVIHWWDNSGGGSASWGTPGAHNNLTSLTYVNWNVTTSYTIGSASGTCSGIV